MAPSVDPRETSPEPDDFFVKIPRLAEVPTPELPADRTSPGPSRMRLWLYLGAGLLALVALWFGVTTVFGSPEPGSREDLESHLHNLGLPQSVHLLEAFYHRDQPVPLGPQYVEWLAIDGDIGATRDELLTNLEMKGIEYEQNSVEPNLIVIRTRPYLYFLVFHEPPYDGPFDNVLPHSIEADFSVVYVEK
jgi:hypothetical protein